mgnify:FL=1
MDNDRLLTERLTDPATRREAFGQMVDQYGEQIYWHVRRMVLIHEDANDVVQNIFLKAWTALDSFRGDSKLTTWLYRIAQNESIDFVRRQQRHPQVSEDAADNGVARQLMADSYFDGDKTEALLHQAISQLPEVQRTVFQMRYFEDMKYSEISQILNTSEGALKASYHIAVKKISEFFHRQD